MRIIENRDNWTLISEVGPSFLKQPKHVLLYPVCTPEQREEAIAFAARRVTNRASWESNMSPADLLKERGIKVINLDYVTSAEAIEAAVDLAGVPGLRATLGDIPWSTRVTQSTMAPHREDAARRLCAVGWRPDMSVGEAWVLLEPRHADRRQPFHHDAGAQRHDDSEP